MNKIKCFFIFLVLCVGMLFCDECKALNLNQQSTGYYFTFTKDNGRNFSDEFIIYSLDSRAVYCIEPGVTMGSTGYYESTLDYLGEEKKNKILDYMHYGYLHYLHADIRYYLATQSLIWEELLNIDQEVVVSTQLFKKGEIIDISSFKNDIIQSIDFYKNQINGEEYTILFGNNLKINDFTFNYVYNIKCDSDNIDVKINHNTIEIDNIKSPGRYEINITERPFYYHDYIVYINDSKQNLLVQGDIYHKEHYIYLNVIGGTLNIYKYDEDNKRLPGATFGIYDSNNNKLYTLTSDLNGEISINNTFSKGLYYIRELSAPTGYEINNSRIYFEIMEDNTVINLDMNNNKIKGRFIIYKKDKEDNLGIDDTIFTIYDKDMNVIDTVTTNKNGMTEITLDYGLYYYKETKANKKYELNDQLYELNINKTKNYYATIYNDKIKGKLIINKKDKDTNEDIENTTYTIYDENMNVIDEITTDEDGLTSIVLDYGTYYYKETKANEKYELDDKSYLINIDKTQDYNVTLFNNKVKGNLIINKKDSKTKEPINNTTFAIYDDAMNKIDEITTDDEGIISIQLEYGAYYYQEIKSNDLYELNDEVYRIDITESKDYVIELLNNKIPEDNYELLIIEEVPNTNSYLNYYLIILAGVYIVKKIH